MSLFPIILNNWCSARPSRIRNQHFGVDLDMDDLLSPVDCELLRCPVPSSRPWELLRTISSKLDTTTPEDKDIFKVDLDVQQFKPDEITVKVTGKNVITVEGKHEEKQDEHGYISRHFVRRYTLPDSHDINNVISNLSSDGVLSITAPRIEQDKEQVRSIPIQETGAPSKAVENKIEKDSQEHKV
ncbi:hypothetical protein ILUMI_20312 [Ignelater luminosus]|uniref:SHSP domain-containing protein n=1 Tax=Ignelater luminosus TaxID=2038154 RepID=A0A8K0CHM8_IGNLU|nr:hypothetical protein ILUMI_20312 [Ignelater luminosus]